MQHPIIKIYGLITACVTWAFKCGNLIAKYFYFNSQTDVLHLPRLSLTYNCFSIALSSIWQMQQRFQFDFQMKHNRFLISIWHSMKGNTHYLYSHYIAAKQTLPAHNPASENNHFWNMRLDPRRLFGGFHVVAQGDFKVQPCSTKVVSVSVFVSSPRTPNPPSTRPWEALSSLRFVLSHHCFMAVTLIIGQLISLPISESSPSWWLDFICACILHDNEGENKPVSILMLY